MATGSLWRSARPLIFGRATSAAVGVLLPVVLARALDRTSYGTYKQVYLVANLALNSLQFGLSQSLFYFIPRAATAKEREAYLAQTNGLVAAVGLATAIGLYLFAPEIATRFSNPEIARLALPIALLAGTLIASSPLEIALTSSGKPQWSAFALVSSDLVRVAMMLVPVLLGDGITGLVWGAALAGCLRWVVSLVIVGGGFTARPSWATLKTQAAYALPFGLSVLLRQQQLQLHQIFVAARATPALFALYAVGCTQVPVVALLYMPVSETLQVRLAALENGHHPGESANLFAEAVDKLALIFLPLSALLIATARPGIELMFGAGYAAAAPIMRVAVVAVAIQALPVDAVLKARARTPTLLWTYAAKLAVTWPAIAFGWSVDGMVGVIAAHTFLDVVNKLGQLAIVAVDLKVPVAKLFGGMPMVRSLGAATVGGAAGLAVAHALAPPLLACVVVTPVALLPSVIDYLDRRRRSRRPRTPAREARATAA